MSMLWLNCCDRYHDLDYDNTPIYFVDENEFVCFDHACQRLADLNLDLDSIIDKMVEDGEINLEEAEMAQLKHFRNYKE